MQATVIAAGADGTGSTSGVLTAADPVETLRSMVAAVGKSMGRAASKTVTFTPEEAAHVKDYPWTSPFAS